MPEIFTRDLVFERGRASDRDASIPATLSTETPVRRPGYVEVLSHEPSAIDLSRAAGGLPVIESHDLRSLPIARAENLRIENRRLRADIRFGATDRARQLYEDAKSGVLTGLSVGYQVFEHRDLPAGRALITRWRPLEVSAVTVPADPQSGFFRSSPMPDDTETVTPSRRAEAAITQAERDRITMIQNLTNFADTVGKQSPAFLRDAKAMSTRCVSEGTDPDVFRRWIMDNKPPIDPTPQAPVTVSSAPVLPSGRAADHLTRAFGESRREAAENMHVAGLWVRAELFGDRDAERWLRDYRGDLLTRSMSGSVQSAGGAVVPDVLSNAIVALRDEYGVGRRYAQVLNMSSDSLLVPKRTSGVSAYYVGEGSEITASDAAFANVGLNTRKLAVLCRLSSELIEDSVVDLVGFLAEDIASSFAEAEDSALFLGDGTSTYGGIVGLASAWAAGSAALVTAATDHDVLTEFDVDDLASVAAKCPIYARRNARWYCSQAAYDLIFNSLLIASGGATMTEQGTYRPTQFWGHEIIVTPTLSQTATGDLSSEHVLYFGDMSRAVMLGSRRELRLKVDESRYLEYDQVAVQATERYDIAVHGTGDSTTPGPLVVLVGH